MCRQSRTPPRLENARFGDQNLNKFREKPLTFYKLAVISSGVFLKNKGIYDNSAISQKFNGKNANSQ
jgi:hypothetical protein